SYANPAQHVRGDSVPEMRHSSRPEVEMNTTKTRRTALQMITLCLVASLALGQNKPSASKSAPPSPVTINMPAGITQQQADAILQELREIHKLLEKQQTAVAAPQPTAAPAAPTKV